MINKRCYSELRLLPTFEERFLYLQLNGIVGEETFGYDRYLNQILYRSAEWRKIRDKVIIRDNGCDLGMLDHSIAGKIYIHHMNPVLLRDIDERNPDILNMEYLISCSHNTHNAIHYGDINLLPKPFVERRPNDTSPWKK